MVPALPLFALGAMTQGVLGSLICLALNELCRDEIAGAVSVVTHMEVDADDPAFADPTKPIGPFFSEEEAAAFASSRGWVMVQDAGRGFRRVVPSPRPLGPIEASAINSLVEAGYVVVAAGGGGIPVVPTAAGAYRGVDAVIDKDYAAERIAHSADAEALVMVTGVPTVRLDFGTDRERAIHEMTADEARHHLADGQFPPGSMGPKVSAAIDFVEVPGRRSAITTPDLVYATLAKPSGVIAGERGTVIVPTPMREEATLR